MSNCSILYDNCEHLRKMLLDSISDQPTPSELPVLSLDINEWPLFSSEKKKSVKSGHSKEKIRQSYRSSLKLCEREEKTNQMCEGKESVMNNQVAPLSTHSKKNEPGIENRNKKMLVLKKKIIIQIKRKR